MEKPTKKHAETQKKRLERRAAALKANLQRRKQQLKTRQNPHEPQA